MLMRKDSIIFNNKSMGHGAWGMGHGEKVNGKR
jgi:hypothetical protein